MAAIAALSACDRDTPTVTQASTSRSEAIHATGQAATAGTLASSTPTVMPAALGSAMNHAPRKLCEDQLGQPGRALPKSAPAHATAPGAETLPRAITTGGGQWTWINFWAAWCGPCKEEMPRLKQWEAKLAAAGTPFRLAFVSVDDDERQLGKFLETQPLAGVRTSYWLPDGPVRDEWLKTLKMRNPPDLPAHALIDPKGEVRCILGGAVDAADYDQVAAIVARRTAP